MDNKKRNTLKIFLFIIVFFSICGIIYIWNIDILSSSFINHHEYNGDGYEDREEVEEVPYVEVIKEVKPGEKVEVPKKEFYIFEGYYTEPYGNGEKLVESDGTVLDIKIEDTSINIYPNWEEDKSYTPITEDPEPIIGDDEEGVGSDDSGSTVEPIHTPTNTPIPSSTPVSTPTQVPEITPEPVNEVKDLIEVRFLNTQKVLGLTDEAILIKTATGKIIAIDLGRNNQDIYNIIKDNLMDMSNNSNVIDKLIISHSHTDHAGNLHRILNDSLSKNITINELIYKYEKYGVDSIINVYDFMKGKSNYQVKKVTDVSKEKNDYKEIVIDNNVTLTLFNLKDVFANSDCLKSYKSISFDARAKEERIKINGKYVYVIGFDNNKLYLSNSTTEIPNYNMESDPSKWRFYAYTTDRTSLCNANANSIAVLLTVKTDIGNKYIYIPSDLENNGYSVFGEYSQSAENSNGFEQSYIYGDGTTHVYEYNDSTGFSFENNMLKEGKYGSINEIKIASESRTANRVKKYIKEQGGDVNNIVIYQSSHHGMNNAKDAIDTLGLNRSNLFTINMHTTKGEKAKGRLVATSYYYTLSNTKKKVSGGSTNGVLCTIKSNGKYVCNQK